MNPFLHPATPSLRHRELLEERAADRRNSLNRRLRRAERLNRRSASLAQRAAALVAGLDR